MSTDEIKDIDQALAVIGQGLQHARKNWWLFLVLGILLAVSGIVAIAYPFVSSVAAVSVLGILLVISGVFTMIGAFSAGKASSVLLQLLVGILYIMAGISIRNAPVESLALITMFVAAFFVIVGAFRIVVSLLERFPQWGWALLNGVVTFLSGIIIYDSYPYSALWLIGLLVGLDLLFNGWTWIMLSLIMRRAPKIEEELAA